MYLNVSPPEKFPNFRRKSSPSLHTFNGQSKKIGNVPKAQNSAPKSDGKSRIHPMGILRQSQGNPRKPLNSSAVRNHCRKAPRMYPHNTRNHRRLKPGQSWVEIDQSFLGFHQTICLAEAGRGFWASCETCFRRLHSVIRRNGLPEQISCARGAYTLKKGRELPVSRYWQSREESGGHGFRFSGREKTPRAL